VDDMRLFAGGGVPNTATALARLGVPVSAVGRIGEDSLGDYLLNALENEEIGIRWIKRDSRQTTSTTMIMVDPDGERRFIHYIGANGNLRLNDIDSELIKNASILHIAYAFVLPGLDGDPMTKILREAKESGVITVLDTAWDAKGKWLELIGTALPFVDYFIPNLAEARAITGLEDPHDIAHRLLDLGVQTVVLKLNKAGCLAMDRGRRTIECPAYPVKVVDTTGAGDAFIAGFIAGIWNGRSLYESLQLANAVGALCVAGAGASGNVRTMMETQMFMAKHQTNAAMDLNAV
jgi:sugar/nucleoside kinase (ribokinase family)